MNTKIFPSNPVNITVKICGLTRKEDIRTVADCGALFPHLYSGFVFVPNSTRFVSIEQAIELVQTVQDINSNRSKRLQTLNRNVQTPGRKDLSDDWKIQTVGVFANCPTDELLRTAELCQLDIVQLHGREPPEVAEKISSYCRVWKAFPLCTRDDLERVLDWPTELLRSQQLNFPEFDSDRICNLELSPNSILKNLKEIDIIADSTGGSGILCNWKLVAELAEKRSILIAGGINPENAVSALQETGAIGLDICSGVESAPGIKSKNKLRKLFTNLKKAAR